MQAFDIDVSLKVIIVGNGQVGKTSMLHRFARGFMTNDRKKTIGTDFLEKDIEISSGDTVKLMLWDTAGQEMFAHLNRLYYKGASAVVYVFSTIDRESFNAIDLWHQKVEEECGDIVSVLVQNKTDLLSQAQISAAEVEDMARRLNIKLYRICVKDNLLIDDVFQYVAEQYVKRGGALNGDVGASTLQSIQSQTSESTAAKQSASEIVTNLSRAGSEADSSRQELVTSTQRPSNELSNSGSFTLQPLTRRTKGKKKRMCMS